MPPLPAAMDTDFAELIARLEPRLMAYLWSACGHRADAEDLFQEVCLALHIEGAAAERREAWAFRVAHNKAVNLVKRRAVERRGLQVVGLRTPAEVPAPQVEHEELEEREVRSARVRSALATLPDQEREAVALKLWGECTWVEIGRVLGISEDAAARLFARGLRAVAPLLWAIGGDVEMSAHDLSDAIAARAAGEDLPGGAALDAELAGSATARDDLARLERLCALIRAATTPPEAERRARALRGPTRARRGWLAAAALVLLAAGAVTLALGHRRGHPPRPDEERDALAGLLAELGAAQPAGTPLGGQERMPPRGSSFGGDGAPAGAAMLRPVAGQASFRALVPGRLPGGLRLARATVVRAAAGPPAADTLWLRYAGATAELVLVETPAAGSAWLQALALPAGWRRAALERDGLALLAASSAGDEDDLRKILRELAPLTE